MDETSDELQRPTTEGQFGPAWCAEQVGHQGEVGALDVAEQKRGPAAGNHAPMNLGNFLDRVDFGPHFDHVFVAPQVAQESAKVRKHTRSENGAMRQWGNGAME
jgi:hypothetical protein